MLLRHHYLWFLLGTIGVVSVWMFANQERWPATFLPLDRIKNEAWEHIPLVKTQRNYTSSVVVASISAEDTSWLFADHMPNLNPFIYVADNDSAPLHPPKNKGREATMYMTHIIDNYDSLTDIVIFIHAHQFTAHNNDLFEWDMAEMLKRLRLEHVAEAGYFNLRCHPTIGCPAEPLKDLGIFIIDGEPRNVFHETWEELHGPNAPPVPYSLAAACCAQFAVTAPAIRRVPRERWVRWRDWLLATPLHDDVSGRVWEFTWHYVLAGHAVLCPDLAHCYCRGYGLCFDSNGDVDALLTMREAMFLADGRIQDLQGETDLAMRLLGDDGAALEADRLNREKAEETARHAGGKLRMVYDNRMRTANIKGKEMFEGYGDLLS